MNEIKSCAKCHRRFNHEMLSNCPGCGADVSRESQSSESELLEYSHTLMVQQIDASNRTTHAIRALIHFGAALFYWLIFSIARLTLKLDDFWSVVFVLLALAATVVSLYRGSREFKASDR
ncbi:MAG: hypothetical protein ORN27_11740 [Rhodoluna sp.]|nr:hypothetical protein [Rhodoluna sp.]